MAVAAVVRIQAGPFDAAAEIAALTNGRRDVGAVVTFSGLCRDESGTLEALELEHYAGMAEDEIGRIAAEAVGRWSLTGLTVIHRFGRLKPGEAIVLVATAAVHRGAAFEAAAYLMDYLKISAPFWKKEHRVEGDTRWVGAKKSDDLVAGRWADDLVKVSAIQSDV